MEHLAVMAGNAKIAAALIPLLVLATDASLLAPHQHVVAGASEEAPPSPRGAPFWHTDEDPDTPWLFYAADPPDKARPGRNHQRRTSAASSTTPAVAATTRTSSSAFRKRSGTTAGNGNQVSTAPASPIPASQLMVWTTRSKRLYDLPQIECPPGDEGMERFACPTPDALGRYRCIDDHVLCDGFIDCPNSEDEDRLACMFFKTTKAHLDLLADALLRWARGR